MTKGYGAGAKLKQPRYVTLDGDKVQAEYWSSLRVGQRSIEGCLVAYVSTYRSVYRPRNWFAVLHDSVNLLV